MASISRKGKYDGKGIPFQMKFLNVVKGGQSKLCEMAKWVGGTAKVETSVWSQELDTDIPLAVFVLHESGR